MFDAAEAGPGPVAFVAVTVNVYGVPFVKPLTVHVNGPDDHVPVDVSTEPIRPES